MANDLFAALGLSPTVDLDAGDLDRRYRAISIECHPDRAAPGDASAHRRAVERSLEVNEAYRVLRDPRSRAIHLLELRGVDVRRDPARPVPQAMLEAVLERRERLDASRARHDAAAEEELVDRVRGDAKRALAGAMEALRAERTQEAADRLVELNYWTRFLEQAEREP